MDVAASQALEPDRKRLHITPFNPDLLDRFIPLSLRPLASGVSFHTVQTYPERGFGYVELPAMEADKLKKKFNGSVLKGSKVKIENAKPEKKRKIEVEEDEGAQKEMKKVKKEKRRREEGVLPGRELEEGRHIKRGWKDEAADKKASKKLGKAKSSTKGGDASLESKKMRFKTTIPPNAAPMEKSKSKSKDGKEKEGRQAKHSAIVQEFAKTQKPALSVGKSKSGKRAVSFEDGQGWVDEEGNVVEAAPKSKKPRKEQRTALVETDQAPDASESAEDPTASETVPVQPSADPMPEPVLTAPITAVTDDESSSSEEPSSEDDQTESEEDEDEDTDVKSAQPSSVQAGTIVETSPSTSPDTEDSAIAVELPAKEVHPLEALFKRPGPAKSPESVRKPKPQPIDTSFSLSLIHI